MKMIPKKIKVKSTIYKNYSLLELLFILVLSFLSFILILYNYITIGIISIFINIILFMPTTDGQVYFLLYELMKYMFSKKQYKKEDDTINKLIYINNIQEDGTIKYNDNTYGKVIKIGSKNFLLLDEESQEVDIECFNNALNQISNSSYIDIIKIDEVIIYDNYINDLNEKINNEKEQTVFETVSMKQKILFERKKYIDTINDIKKQYVPNYYAVIYGNNIKELDTIVSNFIYEIKKSGIECNILDMYKTAIFLKYNFQRDFDEREVYKLKKENLINWIYPENIKFYANKYVINNKLETSLLTINDYPLKVNNGWATNLFNIQNSKVVVRIKREEKYKAINKIDKCILEMESNEQIKNSASEINSANIHKKTMFELLNNLQMENEQLYNVNVTITTYNYDNNNNYKRSVRKKIHAEGFRTSPLFCNQLNGFILSHANYVKNKLKLFINGINSKSLSSFFPFSINYIMDRKGIVLGESLNQKYPFIFNIWKRTEEVQNSNAFVIGKSGSGKTYFMKNLIINEWSNNTKIIICDPEAEYLNITNKLNGNIIDVGSSLEGKINPFHIYKILNEEGLDVLPVVLFNSHLKVLESFFKIVLQDVSNDVLEIINTLVIDTYKYKNIDDQTDVSNLKNSDFPTFSDLMYIIKNKINNHNFDDFTKQKYINAKIHLEKFTIGRYSDIWNNPSTLEINSNIINFNFQSLFANKNNIIANAQMLLIFRYLEQEIINNQKLNTNIKTIIIVDEAHMFIDHKYPIALDFFYQMNKRIRKYNGAFIPVTQNISDWNSDEYLRHKTSTIIKNSQYNFIFRSSSPDMQDILELYKSGNSFNKEERKIITSATTGQAFFISGENLRWPIKIVMNNNIKQILDEEQNNEKN